MQAHGSSSSSSSSSLSELVLRYPEHLGVHPQITYEQAMSMLHRALDLATKVAFKWGYIDKPPDGSLYMIFLVPQQHHWPNDGIRYQDQESRYNIPAPNGRELEVCEIKYGFVPDSSDTTAYRVRRRFRLVKGGHPSLVIVHYSRGAAIPIMPALLGQPVRSYPLRPVNEAPVFVLGEKQGQRDLSNSMHPQMAPGGAGMTNMGAVPPGMQHQAALLAAQNREMEALERRQARERGPGMSGHSQAHDEDSGDEYDHISTRSLALARYKRNHEYMNEVFLHAAYGDKKPKEPSNAYSCFKGDDLKEKVLKLEKEIEELQAKAAVRKEEARRREDNFLEGASMTGGLDQGDISMESLGPLPISASG